MGKPEIKPCLNCDSPVLIFPQEGGRGTGEPTSYQVECGKCDVIMRHLPSNCDGKKATAIREYNRAYNEKRTKEQKGSHD